MKREEPILNIQGSIIYNKRPSSSNVTKTKQTIVNAIQSLPIKEQQIPFKSNIVQIKVKNDKNQEKLFYCNHEILVREIKFFSDLNSNEIQVNCDLNVFAYLMEFVNTRMIKIPNPQASISILVSAKFLLMETLVLVCLDYIANQISAVSMLDIDMSCIDQDSIFLLSSKLSILGLSKITSKNQIKENLFHQKLKALVHSIDSSDFIPHHSKLQKCLLCAKIYSIHESDSKTQLIKPVQTCPKQLQGVDFYGQLSSPHTKDKSFNVDAYINQLHEQKGDWISVYWNVFGQLYFMNCIECHAYLNCIDFLYPGCTHLSSTTQCSCSRSFEPFKKSGCCKTYHKPDLEFCAFKEYFEEFKLNVGQDSVDAHSLSNEYDGVLSFHQWVACPIQDRPIQKSYMIRDQDTANFYDLSAEMIKCRQI